MSSNAWNTISRHYNNGRWCRVDRSFTGSGVLTQMITNEVERQPIQYRASICGVAAGYKVFRSQRAKMLWGAFQKIPISRRRDTDPAPRGMRGLPNRFGSCANEPATKGKSVSVRVAVDPIMIGCVASIQLPPGGGIGTLKLRHASGSRPKGVNHNTFTPHARAWVTPAPKKPNTIPCR